jgi:predicted oxidoreductase
MRKKKAPSPDRKVIKKEEDDMEVFVSDMNDLPDQGNLDIKNTQSSQKARDRVLKGIYEIR